jgi:hypothetical protein
MIVSALLKNYCNLLNSPPGPDMIFMNTSVFSACQKDGWMKSESDLEHVQA